jgi:hypothetical protein
MHAATSAPLPSQHAISQFISKRCDDKLAVWVYDGTLTDHDTGRIVANVKGVELVAALPAINSSSDSGHISWLDKLFVGKLLQGRESQYDAVNTILSRKLFCYTRHSNGKDDELLQSIILRPDGPLRHLSPSESLAVYDTAITFISRGDEVVIFSERGCSDDKSNVMGIARPSSTQQGLEYTIHARKSNEEELPPPTSNEETTVSPQRSRLIQFGKSEEIKRFDAVREKYIYSLGSKIEPLLSSDRGEGRFKWTKYRRNVPNSPEDTKQATIRYTRYGEAPPWYAPGRMCTLDLTGEMIDLQSLLDTRDEVGVLDSISTKLPNILKWSTDRCAPSFWTGWPAALRSSDDGYSKALDLFCTDSPRRVTYDVQRYQSPLRLKVENMLTNLNRGFEKVKQSLICDYEL